MFIDTEAANKGLKLQSQNYEDIVPLQSATRYSEERTPLLDAFVGQAPPSYLEATTPNPWNLQFTRQTGEEGVRLLSIDGRASPALPVDDGYKGSRYRRKSLKEHCTRKRMLKFMGALLGIVILAAIVAAATRQEKKATVVSPIPVPSSQPQDGNPSTPQDYPIRWPLRCGKDYNTKTEEFEFGSPSELRIKEGVHQLEQKFKRVLGWIHVVKGPEDQPAGTVKAKLAYAVSSPVSVDSLKYDYSATGLSIGDISTPDVINGAQKGTACLGISVVVYVAPNASLENFDVASLHLGIQIHEGVSFSITNSTSISLTSGTLDSSTFNSRQTRLETISGSISGQYALLDLLSIKTESGSVNVDISPKEASSEDSPSAIFVASSLSGSIRANFERKHIPERDYQVRINTTVGSVDGTIIHGSKTTISSVAGFLTADIIPFRGGDYTSILETSTTSGQTKLNLHSPYQDSSKPLTRFTSTHMSISGALDITYPQVWEGNLKGSSMNGTLHLQGRDLELIRQEEGSEGQMVEAKKGAGESSLVFGTVSGGIEVKVGKL
ncbi:hypothetical protein CC78DRAFT_343109 [Lojkania enalia]|uniref:Adhesin domain-containing protein n=1 Tax=Lojkania enalia TaxID=147567 RepID=A0A9P4K437_9PLEO|nr:hypothetical protein CC78DRAFT_343109 [Didymosphaeria enalia]